MNVVLNICEYKKVGELKGPLSDCCCKGCFQDSLKFYIKISMLKIGYNFLIFNILYWKNKVSADSEDYF